MLLGERTGGPLKLSLCLRGVVARPGIRHRSAYAGAHHLGKMLDPIFSLVNSAALHQGTGAEDGADRAPQCLGSIDHPQPHPIGIQAAVDQFAEQRPHHLPFSVLPWRMPSACLLPRRLKSRAISTARPRKWMPSIITTRRSTASIRRDSRPASRALLNATKRRDTALFDTVL